jgi:D-hydroxyproline dehydrogenase subunit alpha
MGELRADIVIIGGGPAGIAAATTAAESGVDTLLVHDGLRTGGQIWRHGPHAPMPSVAERWHDRLARSGARVEHGITISDVQRADRWLLLGERDGVPMRIRAAGAIVVAVGARELFLPFPGWTLPGVFGVGGAQALLKSGMQVKGKRAVVAGSGPLLFPVAAWLRKYGASIGIVAEQASPAAIRRFGMGLWRTPARIVDAAKYRAGFRAPYRSGMWVAEARGTDRVTEVVLTDGRKTKLFKCDLLAVGYGLVPSTELARVIGCAVDDEKVTVNAAQLTSVEGVYCAGEPTGIAGLDAALVQGQIAGLTAAGRDQEARRLYAERDRQAAFARTLETTFALRDELRRLAKPETVVCRCEDARYAELAACTSMREAKLYARAGMGPCQGRVCNPALQFMFEWQRDTIRPPVAASLISTLADES